MLPQRSPAAWTPGAGSPCCGTLAASDNTSLMFPMSSTLSLTVSTHVTYIYIISLFELVELKYNHKKWTSWHAGIVHPSATSGDVPPCIELIVSEHKHTHLYLSLVVWMEGGTRNSLWIQCDICWNQPCSMIQRRWGACQQWLPGPRWWHWLNAIQSKPKHQTSWPPSITAEWSWSESCTVQGHWSLQDLL